MYRVIRNYWAAWFPDLPSSQAFSNRLNKVELSFQIINCELRKLLSAGHAVETDHLVDAMPVMLAQGNFARRARVARDIA